MEFSSTNSWHILTYLNTPLTDNERTIVNIFEAASKGSLEDTKAIYQRVQPWHEDVSKIAIAKAALAGHIQIVRFLIENESEALGGRCPYDGTAMENAAINGHMEIVQYLFEKGLRPRNATAIVNAARHGHIHVVKYLLEKGCPRSAMAIVEAATNGHLAIVQYLCENKCPYDNDTLVGAARNNHLHIVRYLCNQYLV